MPADAGPARPTAGSARDQGPWGTPKTWGTGRTPGQALGAPAGTHGCSLSLSRDWAARLLTRPRCSGNTVRTRPFCRILSAGAPSGWLSQPPGPETQSTARSWGQRCASRPGRLPCELVPVPSHSTLRVAVSAHVIAGAHPAELLRPFSRGAEDPVAVGPRHLSSVQRPLLRVGLGGSAA